MHRLNEKAFYFSCQDDELLGICHASNPSARRGVLVLVGGPQYRVGSHRQFILLSRRLAEAGIPAFRFDLRGMGDSGGKAAGFLQIGNEIRCAIEAFLQQQPQLEQMVIWGLCDAASAAIDFACSDARITGVVMLNPWVRTEKSIATTHVRHYYRGRLVSREFWKSVFQGRLDVAAAASSFLKTLVASRTTRADTESGASLPDRVLSALDQYRGNVLIVLSGNDLTAREFEDALITRPEILNRGTAQSVVLKKLEQADHTFSSSQWRRAVEDWTIEFVQSH